MELIDKNSIINFIKSRKSITKEEILDFINNQRNIIYDINKVIEKLEEERHIELNREDECNDGNGDAEEIFSDGESRGKFIAYTKAIDIIKKGGINI